MNDNNNHQMLGFPAIAAYLNEQGYISSGDFPMNHIVEVSNSMPEGTELTYTTARSVLSLFKSFGLDLVPQDMAPYYAKRIGRNLTNASGQAQVDLRKQLSLMARFLWLELIKDPSTYGYRSDDDCLPDEKDISKELFAFYFKFVDNGGAIYMSA